MWAAMFILGTVSLHSLTSRQSLIERRSGGMRGCIAGAQRKSVRTTEKLQKNGETQMNFALTVQEQPWYNNCNRKVKEKIILPRENPDVSSSGFSCASRHQTFCLATCKQSTELILQQCLL